MLLLGIRARPHEAREPTQVPIVMGEHAVDQLSVRRESDMFHLKRFTRAIKRREGLVQFPLGSGRALSASSTSFSAASPRDTASPFAWV